MRDTTAQAIGSSVPEARIVRGLTVAEARDLLDWLEAHAIEPAAIDIDQANLFSVRWGAAPAAPASSQNSLPSCNAREYES